MGLRHPAPCQSGGFETEGSRVVTPNRERAPQGDDTRGPRAAGKPAGAGSALLDE